MTRAQVSLGIVATAAGITVATACAWLFAFGGLEAVASPEDAANRRPATVQEEQAAESAILTIGDLPAGWAASPPDDDKDEDPGFQFSDRCAMLDGDPLPGEIAEAESDDLSGPLRQKVNSEASVFSNDEMAGDAFARRTNVWSACTEEMESAFTEVLQRSLQMDGVTVGADELGVVFERGTAPDVGEESAMFRLTAIFPRNDQLMAFGVDFISYHHGRVVTGLVYTSFGAPPDPEDELQLARLAANKLRAADSALP